MPNPNNNNENQMTEAKKNLYMYEQQMEIIRFDDAVLNTQHRQFTEALHALSRETDRYYTMDEQGNYPVMDEAAFAQFDKLYRQVYGTAASLKAELEKSNERKLEHNDKVWKAVYGALVDSLQDVLGRDLQHLHSVQRQGNETLPSLIEQARIRSYDIDGQQPERVGDNLSSRLGFSIPGPEGEIRGFFTESVRSSEQEELEKLKRDAIAKNPKMEVLLEDFDQEYYLDSFAADDLENNVLTEYENFPGLTRELFGDPESFSRMNEVYEEFNAYCRKLSQIHEKYHMMEAAKLGDADKVDLKNCAMSTVADLLDMKGLLAHAAPVEITYTENGEKKTMKGSFMQHAEGEDLKHQVPGKGLLQPDAPVDTNTASLKQQLSDLQVLDYICGNIDRHIGNMFYKLDETDKAHPKLVGIQGIDNDASFSLHDGQKNQMTEPKNMRVIRRKTADLVEGLTPDMLKTMLRNFNLSQEQLDAVWTRTQKLQEAIRTGKEFYRDKAEDVLDVKQIRVLEDEDFERVNIASLKPDPEDRHAENYFMRAADITNTAIFDYIEDEKARLKKESFDAHGAFFKHESEMKDLRQALKNADSFFRKRPEYQVVLDTAKVLDRPDDSPFLYRKKSDIEQKMTQIETCLAAANTYIQHKKTEYSREMQAARGKGQKAVRQCEEKYKGAKSADAQRLHAVVQLKNKLTAWQADGRKALQLKEEAVKVDAITADADYFNRIRQEMGGKRMKVSANNLREKFGMAEPTQERKTVFRQPAQQKEVKRSNSMG